MADPAIPSIRELADKVDDLSRLVARQSGALGQLAESSSRRSPDIALLVDLHAMRGDALAAASAARSGKERGAFEAIAAGLERLLAGRGGVLVVPRTGHPFSAATMAAAEEVACTDAALDRTVAALLAPGLEADGRTVRPARVAVHRYAVQVVPAQPEPAPPEPAQPQPAQPQPDREAGPPERNGHTRVNGAKASRRVNRSAGQQPEPDRRSRPARRSQGPAAQPEPGAAEPGAAEPAAGEPSPARTTQEKRAARSRPA